MLYRTVVMATCIRACALPAACRLASGHGHYCVRKCLPQGVRMCSNGFARFHSAKSNLSFTSSRAVVVPATLRRLVIPPPLFFVPRRAAVRLLTTASSATDLEQAASGVAPQDSFPPHDPRVPVTIITGFLGSGKTTLLNHVLREQHGKRIAVIENEYGEVDIDGSLVAAQQRGEEDIVMLNNGCMCCTVRGDLVRMLEELIRKRRDKFDHIMIETTGLANPAPIIQTFYMEEHLAHHLRLDGVVTLVDAKHATRHIEEEKPDGVVNEAVEQIAYADRIILNKIDLVTESEVNTLIKRIQRINTLAQVQQAKLAKVDMDYVLGVGGFDLEKVESDLLMEEKNSNHVHEHEHEHVHTEACGHDHEKCGHKDHDHSHNHTHDPGVSSVSIVCEGALDLDKINTWLEDVMNERSDDIYRTKGVLSIDGWDERFIFQGVHSLLEGAPERNWGPEEKRINKLVFIGKKLDEAFLRKGFEECLVSPKAQ